MTELKNAGVDVTPEVSLVPLPPLLYSPLSSGVRSSFPRISVGTTLLTIRLFPWETQNLQNMMGSIGEPGQAGDDVGGRKK
jgi:hypothetical protein